MNNAPIGFLDSGLGGASILREALRILPTENYIYYGDNLRAPYGDLSAEQITAFTFESAEFLIGKGIKAIVIACNTATATCIDKIRKTFALPVISVEPAIKPACSVPGEGKVIMVATVATTRLKRYLDLQRSMPDPGRILNIPCQGLVERIEQGIWAADAYDDLMDAYLSPYKGMQVDAIVLGCTHYIFIKESFERYAKRNFTGAAKLYDGNVATVNQLGRILQKNALENPHGSGQVEFFTSGDRARLEPLFTALIRQGT